MSQVDEQFAGLRKGLLEFALLTVISVEQVYVADILTLLAETPFATQEGTLYPLLSKLRREELVDYEWVESDAGPPRKYYSLTEKGQARLSDLGAYWRRLTTTLESLGR
ncbi:MAG: PadR family transcriptional regulator [Terricaulis sp.]|jgi:PadR family transcriptional regulator PadR